MSRNCFWIIALLMTVLMPGCRDQHQAAGGSSNADGRPSPQSPAALPATSEVPDTWPGKWIGPEGTYLVLSKNADKYVVQINSLDGMATYTGAPNGERIEFQRNGETETIRAGNGHDTGMKWLQDKRNCLIIKTGEGFCRD
jgi:hypothetical protein